MELMYIAETFYSIQGEGKFIGIPTFFIRTSGCNLRCEWRDVGTSEVTRCDTPYTSWNPVGTHESVDELVLHKVMVTNAEYVDITGGEPFLQKELPELASALVSRSYHVSVETNGTIFKELPAEVYMSISPTLNNSVPMGSRYEAMHRQAMRNDDAMRILMDRHDYQFKFVIAEQQDIDDVELLRLALRIPPEKIYLMPEGIDSETIRARSEWIVELCKVHGFNFSDRLHIHLWGNRRGV